MVYIRYVWLYLVLLKYLVCRIHKMPSKIPENICLYHNTWPKQYWLLYIWLYLVMNIPGIFWKYLFNQGTIGCTPNSVPMVFITFCRDSWGWKNPQDTHSKKRGTSNLIRDCQVFSGATQQCRTADVGTRPVAAPRVGGARGDGWRCLVFIRGPVQYIEESNIYLCLMYIGSREYWLLDRSQRVKKMH